MADKPLVISAALQIQARVTHFQPGPPGEYTLYKLTGHSFSYGRSLGTDEERWLGLRYLESVGCTDSEQFSFVK